MSQRIVVSDLLSQVRAQLNEENREEVTDTNDLIPALNRGQNYATDILARHYREALLTQVIIPSVTGQDTYDLPADSLEQRIVKLDVHQNKGYFEMQYISILDSSLYEIDNGKAAIPIYYTVVGNQFKVFPEPSGAYPFRLWYLKEPEPLMLDQGRINIIDGANNAIRVDTIGPDISAQADNLSSFVNIVDGVNGTVKATMQVQSINGNKITFKEVPTRTVVLDLNVDTDILAPASKLTITQDDYICLAPGTCVPFFRKPVSNFLVQYAVSEITRKLGGDAPTEEAVLKKFEDQVEHTWANRPNAFRVKKRNASWSVPIRRLNVPLGH